MLDPHLEVAPFLGRSAELGELLAWCADGQDTPVRLITGPAGAGKTRLAVEFAHRMRARGWRTEWLKPPDAAGSTGSVAQRKSLLIIDDADRHDGLAELLTGLVRTRPEARILLLAREAGRWCDQAELAGPIAHALITIARSALIDLAGLADAELTDQEVAGQAAAAFAAVLELPGPGFKLAGAGEAGRYLVLDLHIAALVGCAGEPPDPPAPNSAPAALLDLEQRYWDNMAGRAGLEAEPGLLRQLVAAGWLLGAGTAEDAVSVAAVVAGEAGASVLGGWLRDVLASERSACWPGALARLLVASELDASPQFALRCLSDLSPAGFRRVMPLLTGPAAAEGGGRRAEVPQSVLALVAGQLLHLKAPNFELIPIIDSLPYPDATWAAAGAAICGLIVSQLPPQADQGTRAYWLNSLSARLWLAGRQLEAVGAAEEAVGLRRELAAMEPDRYLASLAVSLSYLAIQYAGLRRTDDAVLATEEAAGVRRRLAAGDPERYSGLADAAVASQ